MEQMSYQDLGNKMLRLLEEGRRDLVFDELCQRTKNNEKDAFVLLAQMYLQGGYVQQDIDYALDLAKKGSELGSVEATRFLGDFYYENDLGYPTDKNKALEYYDICARAGDAQCCNLLFEIYLKDEGLSEHEAKAFQYVLKSAKLGDDIGMVNTAKCYCYGIGTDKDPFAACYWFKEYLKYKPENAEVMYLISMCLSDFDGSFGHRDEVTPQMLREAFEFAISAFNKGYLDAFLFIAFCYENGFVVSKDLNMAYKYTHLAADEGNERARAMIKRFGKTIFGKYYIRD